jgi:hypothetical protein
MWLSCITTPTTQRLSGGCDAAVGRAEAGAASTLPAFAILRNASLIRLTPKDVEIVNDADGRENLISWRMLGGLAPPATSPFNGAVS